MIPEIGKDGPITASVTEAPETADSLEMPSLTYRMDWERKRISSHTDGLEAVKQAAVKILNTLRYEHLIYSTDYGTEWDLILGQDRLLVRAELRRILTEALLQDDRITGVDELSIAFNGDNLDVSCTVVTSYGSFRVRKEMNGDG